MMDIQMPAPVRWNLDLAAEQDARAIDADRQMHDLDKQIADAEQALAAQQKQLADLKAHHAELGRAHTEATANADLHRRMVTAIGYNVPDFLPAPAPVIDASDPLGLGRLVPAAQGEQGAEVPAHG